MLRNLAVKILFVVYEVPKHIDFFFVAVDNLKQTLVEKLPSDLEGLEASFAKLQSLIDSSLSYVDDVLVRSLSIKIFLSCLNCDSVSFSLGGESEGRYIHRPLSGRCSGFCATFDK